MPSVTDVAIPLPAASSWSRTPARGRAARSRVQRQSGSRHLPPAALRLAGGKGLRLIGVDPPGYGGSTAQPGRRIADSATDARAIANALGITRLAVWGISGGGPIALACAALLPDLAFAACVFASLGPYGEPGLDFLDFLSEARPRRGAAVLRGPSAGPGNIPGGRGRAVRAPVRGRGMA